MRNLSYIIVEGVLIAWLALLAPTVTAAEPAAQESWIVPAAPDLKQRHISRNFVILHQHDDAWAATLSETLEEAYADFYDLMDAVGLPVRAPQQRLLWLCFDETVAFRSYSLATDRVDLSRLPAYYSGASNSVAMTHPAEASNGERLTTLEIARHEVMHQLAFNSGLQRRGVAYPLWVSEGLATALEVTLGEPAAEAVEHWPRRQALVSLNRSGRLLPLDELSVLVRVPMDADSQVAQEAYNQSWGFFSYCLQKRPASLRRYLDLMQRMPRGRPQPALLAEVFARGFGSPSRVEKEWRAFVDRLDRQEASSDIRVVRSAPAQQP